MTKVRIVGARSTENTFCSEERQVTSAVKVTDGDLVKLASGRVSSDTVNGKIYAIVTGGSNDDLVSRSYRAPETTGDVNGTKKVLVQLLEGIAFEMDASASLQADAEGSYFLITGATGAQKVNQATKSATVGQLLCLQRISTNAAGTEFKRGLFTVAALTSATTVA